MLFETSSKNFLFSLQVDEISSYCASQCHPSEKILRFTFGLGHSYLFRNNKEPVKIANESTFRTDHRSCLKERFI